MSASLRLWVSPRRTRRAQRRLVGLNHAARDRTGGPLRDLFGLRVTNLFLQEDREDREAPGMLILRHSCFPSTLGFTAEDAEGAEKTCWVKSLSRRPNRSDRFEVFGDFV